MHTSPFSPLDRSVVGSEGSVTYLRKGAQGEREDAQAGRRAALESMTYMITPSSPSPSTIGWPIGKPWVTPSASAVASKNVTSMDASVGP